MGRVGGLVNRLLHGRNTPNIHQSDKFNKLDDHRYRQL